MNEFAQKIREEAVQALQSQQQQKGNPDNDPIVELVAVLVEEGTVTTDQWLTWNQLAMDRPEELSQMITKVLEYEKVKLPQDQEALREWAASLLVNTLDRFPQE
ncbi:MAG: hypothetical protein WD851_17320 [Pirellulales bacterium]